ncbi:MAG: metalloregulator ArsR/SmtB family transcription factor [Deltaproteobacteria bacterium]|nr:metalloregulator ArsR/SmtB family transcription factor [Deltaproteobacteria bacterium]
MEKKAKIVAQLLKILANENRLLILCALASGAKTVGEIGEFIPNITQSALSQHLNYLKTASILSASKNGQYVTYSIADGRVVEVLNTLKKHYCQ